MSHEPRRPFQDQGAPGDVLKSGEFKRVFLLLGLLVLVGGGFVLFQLSLVHKAEEQQAARVQSETHKLVPKEKLTPEQIEARRIALLSKFEGALSDVENDQPLNYNETPGYRKLLEQLIRFTPEEITQRTQVEFDWQAAMDDPDGWRGEFVRARGILSEMWAIRLKSPVLGRPDVYRAVLSDGENPFFIDLTERPPDLVSDSRDVLEVEGVFYRTVKYEGRDGSWQRQPLLVVRNLHRVEAVTETGWRQWLSQNGLWVIAGMAIFVISAVLLFSSFRRQRRPLRGGARAPQTIHDMFDQKLRESGKVPPPRS